MARVSKAEKPIKKLEKLVKDGTFARLGEQIGESAKKSSAEKKAFDANQLEIDRLTAEVALRDEYITYIKSGGKSAYERWLVEREPIFK